MAAEEPDDGFKVTDRRHRPDDDEEPARTGERVREAGPTPAPAPREVARPVAEPVPPAAVEPGPGDDERSLVGLFMMLGSSALMALGEAADPVTGQRQRDVPAAADVIDVLLLLREKTEGHRSPEETQVLDELVYDLQLRYVRATKPSG